MKKLLLGTGLALGLGFAGSAYAADLPMKTPAYQPPPPSPPAWSWTGFYLGVQGGAGWGTTDDSITASEICFGSVSPSTCSAPFSAGPQFLWRDSYSINGWHGGGTAGFNWQTGPVVFGVEGDISGANINGHGDCSGSFGLIVQRAFFSVFTPISADCHTSMTWFGTVTGRIGLAVDHALLYVKAGGAWAHFNRDVTTGESNAPGSGQFVAVAYSIGENRWGVTAGAGVEYTFWGNWSAKIEYDYMDFGTKNVFLISTQTTAPSPPGFFLNLHVDDRERVHVVRAGLNYRFWWGKAAAPVVARY